LQREQLAFLDVAHWAPGFAGWAAADHNGPAKEPAMIIEYIRYTIDAARQASFRAAYETAAQSLRDSEHCLGYELSQCTEAKEAFVLRIMWDSEEGHLKGFRTSAQFKPFLTAIQPFVKDIAEMRHYAATPIGWTRSHP
jgi:quinol monooxygenase YgiN